MADKYPYPESTARFARDTKHHKMTVLHDDGLYRHLRFQHEQWHPPLLKPVKRSSYWFDLVTIPGALIFQGDGDSYTFRRLDDMFEFFRQPSGARINPGYWSEKLVGAGGQDQATGYQQDLLIEYVNDTVADAVKHDPKTLAGLADAVRERILDELIGDESIDRQLVDSFRFWANDSDEYAWPSKRPDFEFVDTFDITTRDYDWWFLWACNAIVWGIAQYDAHAALPRPITSATPARLRKAVALKCTPLAVAMPEPTAEVPSRPASPTAPAEPATRPSGRFVDAPAYAFNQPIVEVQLPEPAEVTS